MRDFARKTTSGMSSGSAHNGSFAFITTPLSELGDGNGAFEYPVSVDDGSEFDMDMDEEWGGSVAMMSMSSAKTNKKMQPTTPSTHPTNGSDAIPCPVNSDYSIQTGQWSTGICNCCESCVPNCCMVMLCPCISEAQIATRLGYTYCGMFTSYIASQLFFYLSLTLGIRDLSEDTTISGWAYLAIFIQLAKFLSTGFLRTRVRRRFKLPGNLLGDCCLTCCCSWCSVAQMATHLKTYKPGSCAFGPPDELAAYES